MSSLDSISPTLSTEYKLKPLHLTVYGEKYFAFNTYQMKNIIKELSTLEYMVWQNEINERWITDLEDISSKRDKQIESLKIIDDKNRFVIATKDSIITQKDEIIHIKNKNLRRANLNLKIVSGLSIGVIGALLFIK